MMKRYECTYIVFFIFHREQEDYFIEKYKHKWNIPIRDLELKESALTPDLQFNNRGEGNRLNILSPKYGNVIENF